MLIFKISLRKFIHEVTRIIPFDCHDNSSHIQQNSTCKAGSVEKRKMHVELARLHLQQFLFHKSFAECLTKKKSKQDFASSYGVCLQKREQEPLVNYGKVLGIRRVSRFSRKCLQIPVSC